MKEKQASNLVWWILGGVVILGIGGFIIYKASQGSKVEETSSNQQSVENNNKPKQANIPPTDSSTTTQIELEKYLLEKRLDLQKYFVFNLGEVKTWEQKKTLNSKNTNVRAASGTLTDHFTKAAASFQKQLEQKGYGIKEGRFRKELICFLAKDQKEWSEDKLDQKISNEKECYIIFKKNDEDDIFNWFSISIDENGKQWLHWTNAVNVKTDLVFHNKTEALEFLTINDPALKWALKLER